MKLAIALTAAAIVATFPVAAHASTTSEHVATCAGYSGLVPTEFAHNRCADFLAATSSIQHSAAWRSRVGHEVCGVSPREALGAVSASYPHMRPSRVHTLVSAGFRDFC